MAWFGQVLGTWKRPVRSLLARGVISCLVGRFQQPLRLSAQKDGASARPQSVVCFIGARGRGRASRHGDGGRGAAALVGVVVPVALELDACRRVDLRASGAAYGAADLRMLRHPVLDLEDVAARGAAVIIACHFIPPSYLAGWRRHGSARPHLTGLHYPKSRGYAVPHVRCPMKAQHLRNGVVTRSSTPSIRQGGRLACMTAASVKLAWQPYPDPSHPRCPYTSSVLLLVSRRRRCMRFSAPATSFSSACQLQLP